MTLVSVIMPCYNASKYLSESIESVLSQTYKYLELIVVDDGSSDDTLEILNAYAKKDSRVKVVSQNNSGVSMARNTGVKKSKGQYLSFLDSDDWWSPSFIEKMLFAIKKEQCILAYCGWQNVGLPGKKGKPFIPPNYEQMNDKVEKLLAACRWPIHAVIMKKTDFIKTGGFKNKLKTSEDFYIWLRLAVKNKISLVPEVLAYYRHHGGVQASLDVEKMVFDHLYVQQEFLEQYSDIAHELGNDKVRELTYGEVLKKGYDAYWNRNLYLAHKVFRYIIKVKYFKWKDVKYVIPAILPFILYKKIYGFIDG